ncbi:uncharacterized protein DSM5745_05768 [Aspergillus mulundensis]|uniref:Cyanovirin-N domain-containing protein n=1 Tax=Aspergillus mulundensis TaxID=1810919 RepID=A0A3D8RY24_9EURO|nr:Uncharacterized protein DSM5745_05768 [Aspergillus mulundensis]RDW78916.1 Uncharacterized protein DSM5745_05768 [Aspergillus mulundensis]
MQLKTLLPILSVVAGTSATLTVSFSGFYYASCATPSIMAANLFSGACDPVQNLPIQSFSAHVYSGTCDDASTSPVLKLYTQSGCGEDSLYGEYELSDEETCFDFAESETFVSGEVVCQ